MADDLTLPATIRALARPCTPVALRPTSGIDYGDIPEGAEGVVLAVHPERGIAVAAFRWADDPDDVEREGIGEVRLDDFVVRLGDATGRAHARDWLAAQLPEALPSEVDGGGRPIPIAACGLAWVPDSVFPLWALESWNCNYRQAFVANVGGLIRCIEVPTLADLDPDDDTRLPDGSRRVDALALRAVVLHVAGEEAVNG